MASAIPDEDEEVLLAFALAGKYLSLLIVLFINESLWFRRLRIEKRRNMNNYFFLLTYYIL